MNTILREWDSRFEVREQTFNEVKRKRKIGYTDS